MSAFNKAQEFEEAAKKAEEEFMAQYQEAQPESDRVEETTVTESPTPEPEAVDTVPTPEPAQSLVDEEKYKAAVKAMNEAQRQAAEAKKREEEFTKKQSELEAQLQEALNAAKAAKTQPEPEYDWEADMPEVAKIAEAKANRVQAALDARLAEIAARVDKFEEMRKAQEAEAFSKRLLEEVTAVHPDYQQVVNSDEMVAWINNEAPPIYQALFAGTVPITAKDAIAVVNAFKSTLAPSRQATTGTPSPAEVAAPVKAVPSINTKSQQEKVPTEKEMEWFMHNAHKLSASELADWDRRLSAIK